MPGKKSTGQKTPAGNTKVARNAYKGGTREALLELRKVLRKQERVLSEEFTLGANRAPRSNLHYRAFPGRFAP